jgi:hypothetical protein
MSRLMLWASAQLGYIFLMLVVTTIALFLALGGSALAIYAASKRKPHMERISERQQPQQQQVTTLSVRRRMEDAIGTGHEIGVRARGDPKEAHFSTDLRAPQGSALPPAGLVQPEGAPPEAQEAQLPKKSTVPASSMPLLHALRATDRNTLHPGTFTVIPARCRPPTTEDMLPRPPSTEVKGIPEEQALAAPIGDPYEGVDLTLMGLDAKRQREQMKTIIDEPGDAVKAAAVVAQEAQASATFEPLPPTVEERVYRAIQLHGLLPDRLLKPKQGEPEAHLEIYVQYGQASSGSVTKSAKVLRAVAAHKLKCSARAKELAEVVRSARAMKD